ncbi:MAG: hypothetical protein HKN47_20735 [Pirellulaceae bacterium]|nr:hypothetical protein [Pirellulaceae bacterium]
MWSTTNGPRMLVGDEAQLVRAAIGTMVDQLVDEFADGKQQHEYAIAWFDNWDAAQRLWLLDRVTVALLTDAPPPSPAAMLEATVDAIFANIIDQVLMEIDQQDHDHIVEASGLDCFLWRQRTIDAFIEQNERPPNVDVDSCNETRWRIVVTQVADAILGVPLYQQAESFRDGDIEQTRQFLMQKGLPEDFLEPIPPLQTNSQTRQSIDQIQSLVFD